MINAVFNHNELIINSSEKIIFDKGIKEIILDENKVYILLDIPL
ncbi:hypothetical protein [Fusobacterium sp. PH5-44]